MGWGNKRIHAAVLGAALAMPAFTHGAETSAEEAFLTRISSEVVVMQRDYMRTAVGQFVKATDIAAFRARLVREEALQQWYVEDIYDGVPVRVNAALLERWAMSPSMSYHLETTDIPDCAQGSVMLPTCP
ncbi:hypothetical protein HJB51_26185 [Rhizobium lentis]|uniref:hypothetical protein n=1 Tax=Rhizobium lentis TaxID=1138194 RepID=UPI001C8351C0|nr:hypothetical protein [Rhizobium lentis]MBX4973108.1 hypothetical protein [Rhizobium lentis]MBX4998256.1 hypothetical protein [Rhizobium lentis]MBX5016618.1 hypothetical protein [Rhizobium lentis]MBX5043448.1 hypothetical protein [Rhizobium lentis]MBX5056230.1 hypothetical protein [Rhizobium lentis]